MIEPARLLLSLLLSASPARAATVPAPGAFPCDVGSLADRPAVMFLAEEHRDRLSNKIKRFAMEGAAKGRYYLATEVIRPDELAFAGPLDGLASELGAQPGQARLFGLEGSPATYYSFLWVYTSAYNLAGWGANDGPYMFKQIAVHPGLKEAFAAAAASGHLPPRAAFLARAAIGRPEPSDARQPAPFSQEEDSERMREASIGARVEAARLVKAKYNEPWVDAIMSRLDDQADTGDIMLAMMVAIRNRDFARGIASAYCAAAAEKRNLAVAMGYRHVEGVREVLSSWSPARLDMKEFNTREADEADDARETLRAWAGGQP